jgi:plastocyanin
MPRLRSLTLALGLTVLPGASASAAVAPAVSPDVAIVLIFGSSYHPPTMTVAPGTTIAVINEDGLSRHSLTSKDGSFDTGILRSGDVSYIDAPEAVGRYRYSCRVHGPSVMKGVIVVSLG